MIYDYFLTHINHQTYLVAILNELRKKCQQIYGEIFDMHGRFDFMIAAYPITVLYIGGSYHIDQVN